MSKYDDDPVFDCQGCGKRGTDDGGDSLLGWAHDQDGELAFCATCGPPPLSEPTPEMLARFHDMQVRANARGILRAIQERAR